MITGAALSPAGLSISSRASSRAAVSSLAACSSALHKDQPRNRDFCRILLTLCALLVPVRMLALTYIALFT